MRSLLTDDHFEPILSLLRGKRWGYAHLHGNSGDDLIRMGTFDLLDRNSVEHVRWKEPHDYDGLLLSGGGNIGGMYRQTAEKRARLITVAKERRLQIVCLPQSILPQNTENLDGVKVFVRDRYSLSAMPSATLCPDMALAFMPRKEYMVGTKSVLALRKDVESSMPQGLRSFDPAESAFNAFEYLDLASKYGVIVTDRLHFAISGLIVGSRVTLLPNNYHKNRGMWEAWLSGLGCLWRDWPKRTF